MTENKLNLGDSRLLVGSTLGDDFVYMLEQDEPVQLKDSVMGEKIKRLVGELQGGKHFLEVIDSEEARQLVASALRFKGFESNLILGADITKTSQPNANGFLSVLGSSLGLPSESRNANAIRDRASDRNFCVVISGVGVLEPKDEENLLKNLKKISSVAGVFVIK